MMWECPEMDLSDAWGILSSQEADTWIESGASTSSAGTEFQARISEVVRAGRAGLRIGNMRVLKEQAQAGMSPADRVEQLWPEDDPQGTGATLN